MTPAKRRVPGYCWRFIGESFCSDSYSLISDTLKDTLLDCWDAEIFRVWQTEARGWGRFVGGIFCLDTPQPGFFRRCGERRAFTSASFN